MSKSKSARRNPTRAETARTNGAQSHGPVTPEGLAHSSRNALRHGLTARAVVLETESQPEFDLLLDSFLHRFQPADAVEQELVEAMAAARWRLRRLRAIESSILEVESLRQAEAIDGEFTEIDDTDRLAHAFTCLADNGHSLALLIRYESALNRTFDRALKQLLLLQSSPRPESPSGSFRNPPSQPDPPVLSASIRGQRVFPPRPPNQPGSMGKKKAVSLRRLSYLFASICVHPRPKGLFRTFVQSAKGAARPIQRIEPSSRRSPFCAAQDDEIWQDCTYVPTAHPSRTDPGRTSREHRVFADRFRYSRLL